MLLIDATGEIVEAGYFADVGEKEKLILLELDRWQPLPTFNTDQNVAVIECGWLNLSVIGPRFGHDKYWTREFVALEKDPLFYLNIARDLLRYDSNQQSWTRDLRSMQIFEKLANLRNRLAEIGIVSDPDDSAVAQQSEYTIPITVSGDNMAKIDHVRKNLYPFEYVSRTNVLEWAVKHSLAMLRDDPTRFLRLFRR